jgi:hypothetical protein
MNANEGMHRIVLVIRAIGVLIAVFGIIAIANEPPDGHLLPMAIMTAIFAVPFFVVAWIVDGFAVDRASR